jgi:hypothetical protein
MRPVLNIVDQPSYRIDLTYLKGYDGFPDKIQDRIRSLAGLERQGRWQRSTRSSS